MAYERDPRLDSTDWIVILGAFLGALKIFLASLPAPYAIRIDDATISALVNLVAFGMVLWGIVWGNWKKRKVEYTTPPREQGPHDVPKDPRDNIPPGV